LLRRLVQAPDHPDAELRGWQQIITALSRRIQLRHRLIQVRPDPARQPGSGP
jgi:hypothetical protein